MDKQKTGGETPKLLIPDFSGCDFTHPGQQGPTAIDLGRVNTAEGFVRLSIRIEVNPDEYIGVSVQRESEAVRLGSFGAVPVPGRVGRWNLHHRMMSSFLRHNPADISGCLFGTVEAIVAKIATDNGSRGSIEINLSQPSVFALCMKRSYRIAGPDENPAHQIERAQTLRLELSAGHRFESEWFRKTVSDDGSRFLIVHRGTKDDVDPVLVDKRDSSYRPEDFSCDATQCVCTNDGLKGLIRPGAEPHPSVVRIKMIKDL